MKYLKLYESFTQPNISNMMSVMAGFKKVRDFCDEYLAFLKDEGFKVEIGRGDNNSEIIIKILKPQYHESLNHINYNWSEVRDDVIPFYQILKEKFNVVVANAVTNYAKSASEIPSGIKLDGLIDDLSDKIIHYVYIKVNLDTNIKVANVAKVRESELASELGEIDDEDDENTEEVILESVDESEIIE